MNRLARLSTGGLNGKGERFLSEMPLHEGRRDGVNRSSGVDLFAGAEGDTMRCVIGRYRIGPGDGSLVVAE